MLNTLQILSFIRKINFFQTDLKIYILRIPSYCESFSIVFNISHTHEAQYLQIFQSENVVEHN